MKSFSIVPDFENSLAFVRTSVYRDALLPIMPSPANPIRFLTIEILHKYNAKNAIDRQRKVHLLVFLCKKKYNGKNTMDERWKDVARMQIRKYGIGFLFSI